MEIYKWENLIQCVGKKNDVTQSCIKGERRMMSESFFEHESRLVRNPKDETKC